MKWHERNRRDFPWRRSRDPYTVLVAEMMLQRTRAEQVSEVFQKFISRFPDPASVASSADEEVLRLLSGLGLRHRAVKLLEALREIARKFDGRVPSSYEDLVSLPGVGPYTASAVLSFGFGRRAPIVDSNIARFYSRFLGIRPKRRPHLDPEIREAAAKFLPEKAAPEFNEALLDFTSMICAPKPRCNECPLRDLCNYVRKASH